MIVKDLEKIIALAAEQYLKSINFSVQPALTFEIERPEKQFGDYATNIVFNLAKISKKSISEISQNLILLIKKDPLSSKYFEKIEERNGFLNFWLRSEVLNQFLDEWQIPKRKLNKAKGTIVIDYSSPNISKPFGIGHFRSTNIGAALKNIHKYLGYQVIGDNHLGDWGTQFGALLYQIKNTILKDQPKWRVGYLLSRLTLKDLEKLYVDFNRALEKQPELQNEARTWFQKLESGDKEARLIWKFCVKISLKEFKRLYKLLGVKFECFYGESFYEDKMSSVINELKEKSLAQISEGALVVFYPDSNLPPGIVLKSNQSTTYLTRDLAALKYRLNRWQPKKIIYEVGAEQTLHFQQLFLTAQLLGWIKETELIHIAHGLFESEKGKLSTRAGQTVYLEDVINEAIKRVEELLAQNAPKISYLKRKKLIKQIAIGALKYNDLSQHYSRNIVFDWNKILNLTGNSGPYLQYTYARSRSVLLKAPFSCFSRRFSFNTLPSLEKEILRQISQFEEVIISSARECSPHLISTYLFELAQLYNQLYNNYPILKAEKREKRILRLKITRSVANIIKIGLELLGIETPLRM